MHSFEFTLNQQIHRANPPPHDRADPGAHHRSHAAPDAAADHCPYGADAAADAVANVKCDGCSHAAAHAGANGAYQATDQDPHDDPDCWYVRECIWLAAFVSFFFLEPNQRNVRLLFSPCILSPSPLSPHCRSACLARGCIHARGWHQWAPVVCGGLQLRRSCVCGHWNGSERRRRHPLLHAVHQLWPILVPRPNDGDRPLLAHGIGQR